MIAALLSVLVPLAASTQLRPPVLPDTTQSVRDSSLRRHAHTAPQPPLSSDTFRFLDNGIIRLGIDLSRGATLGFLGPSSDPTLSLLNVHDFGRVVQASYYSGPDPFNPDGKCSEPGGWGRPWPWNPIGAGDVYLHAAPILNVTVSPSNTSAVVWTQPMQWACDSVPCDCVLEQHIALVGAAVEVQLTLHTARTDTTFYPGSTQELPAVYVIGDFCHLWTYNESAPFTGGAPTEQPAVWGVNAWDAFTSGERWMAFTNASGYGVGVVSPFVAHFGAGFFNNGVIGVYNCTPKGLGPTDSPTGYIAPWSAEIIDPATPYTYSFALVLGELPDIQAYASARYAKGDSPLVPSYAFTATGTRAHCVYRDAEDSGLGPALAARGGLALAVTGPTPTVVSPITLFSPAAAPVLLVNASYTSLPPGVSQAAMWWVPMGASQPCPACVLLAPIAPGSSWQVLQFALHSVPAYTGLQAVTQVLFQPFGAAPLAPADFAQAQVALASILTQAQQ